MAYQIKLITTVLLQKYTNNILYTTVLLIKPLTKRLTLMFYYKYKLDSEQCPEKINLICTKTDFCLSCYAELLLAHHAIRAVNEFAALRRKKIGY